MTIIHDSIHLCTEGDCDVHDVTREVETLVAASSVTLGLVTISVASSTAAVTTCEFEPGMVRDLQRIFEQLIPRGTQWAHNSTWGDANGHSHLRASLVGPSLSLPIVGSRVQRGTWQQIVVIDFDNRPRDRAVSVVVMGDAT
ncbi:MAG: secondary thiamine-phosphate synthase enzyme YjbQ [Candidatus Eisenbacteria bacterium]|jgi:secondary thiamine-phosphate synthase enzyme|nr:secondary thiamine-phosphate synthase enzyme YjbQ [Candidatus Eisenbacteria bacterium]